MSAIFRTAFVCLVFAINVQAAEPPAVVVLDGHTDSVHCAAFSPDGKKVVTTSFDYTARIWDAETGKELKRLDSIFMGGRWSPVWHAAYSPDGRRIVTASGDGTVQIWLPTSGLSWLHLVGHTDVVNSAAFSPDGKKVVTAGWDATVRIWDANNKRDALHTLLVDHRAESAEFSPDGKKVISICDNGNGGGTVQVWDAETGKEILKLDQNMTHWVNSAAFSPDGKKIITAHRDQHVRIWDAESGKELKKMEVNELQKVREGEFRDISLVYSAVFSPDGKKIVTLATVYSTENEEKKASGIFRIGDAESGKELQKLEGHEGRVFSAVFSPDGKKIVTASEDGTARIWDLERYAAQPPRVPPAIMDF
jgi:WD40 repeat protein